MTLYELLDGVNIVSSKVDLNTEISKPFSDSRKATQNGLFVAIKGESRNGNDYINDALNGGACCAITDDEIVYSKCEKTILVINARHSLSYIWHNFYQKPTKSLNIIAITGTNGKTSCAYYLYNILRCAGEKCGLISTIECLINGVPFLTGGGSEVSDIASAMTTPDPEVLYNIFNEMKEKGVKYVVMEASSHSLSQSKLAPIDFLYGIFTNLSPEHMDYHKDMESYYLAKRSLFDKTQKAVVNVDDDSGRRLSSEIASIRCSLMENGDFVATDVFLDENGCDYILKRGKTVINIKGKICGEFSVYNTMLASTCALDMGIEIDKVREGIFLTNKISGRLEKVRDNIFIDYAHTPLAIESALKSIKKIAPQKRIISLFGCGGDRDKEKRPKMGKIATQLSDFTIITSDNSRSESLTNIFRDILSGIDDAVEFCLIPNRKDAIKYGISILKDNDIFILFGKGHENYEITQKGKSYFSEKDIINDAVREKYF